MILKIKISQSLLILFLILILAFSLRVWDLTKYPMETDEAQYLFQSQQIANDISWIWKRYTEDPYWLTQGPPLRYYMTALFFKLLGSGEFTMKLLSAIMGTLTVAVVYLIGKEIIDSKAGIFAALVLSVSLSHVFFSRTGYNEPYFAFFATLMILFFIKGLKTYSPKKLNPNFLISSLFFTASYWVKWTGIILLPAVLIWIFIFRRDMLRDKSMIIYLLPPIIAFLPMIPYEMKFNFSSFTTDLERFSTHSGDMVLLPSRMNMDTDYYFPERAFSLHWPLNYLGSILMHFVWSPITATLAYVLLIYFIIRIIKQVKISGLDTAKLGSSLTFFVVVFIVILLSFSRLAARAHRVSALDPLFACLAGVTLFKFSKFRFGTILILLILFSSFTFTIHTLAQLDYTPTRDVGLYLKEITTHDDYIAGPMQTLFGYYAERGIAFFNFRCNEMNLIKNGLIDYFILQYRYWNHSTLCNEETRNRKEFIEDYMNENKTFYYNGKIDYVIYQSKNPLSSEGKKLRNCLFYIGNSQTCQRMMQPQEFAKAYDELKGRML